MRRQKRRGLSLLEVMLSVAILGGSMVAIGELIRVGTLSAGHARDLTQAQLLCESTMTQVLAGAMELNDVTNQTFDPTIVPGAEGWNYSIEIGQTELEGVVNVRVTVQQDRVNRPVVFSLTAWMIDPEVEFAEPEEDATTSGGTSGAGTSGTGS